MRPTATRFDIMAVIDGSDTAAATPGDRIDLLAIHGQLLNAAHRGHHYLEAAQIVAALDVVAHRARGVRPDTIRQVLQQLVDGLRRGPLPSPADENRRFAGARGWLQQAKMERRAASRNPWLS